MIGWPAAVASLALSMVMAPDDPPLPPCHVRDHIGIVCLDADNAAELYLAYAGNSAALSAPSMHDYLNRFDCALIHDDGHSLSIKAALSGKVATAAGYVRVYQIDIDNGQHDRLLYAAQDMFDRPCPVQTTADIEAMSRAHNAYSAAHGNAH